MRIDPADQKLVGEGGSTFMLDVLIDDVTDLGAFEFELRFDDSKVSANSVTEGPFLSSGGGSTVCFSNILEDLVRLGCVLVGGSGASGSGTVGQVELQFHQNFDGILQFLLVGCQAADPDGDLIALNGCKNATATVNPPPGISLSPVITKVFGTPGTMFSVDVLIAGVADVGGVEFKIEFDPALLNLVDLREGPFMGSEGGDLICLHFESEPGLWFFGCVVQGKQGTPDGAGVLAEADFVIKQAFVGPSDILLVECAAGDSQGIEIPIVKCTGGAVQANPTPTPTFTPTFTPTLTPTATPTPTAPAAPPIGGISRAGSVAIDRAARAESDSGPSAPWSALAGAFAILCGGAIVLGYRMRRHQAG
jgi:hypothetical protein